ncbi:Hpt domain-containing protein [Ruminococcaceae bacterium OttesenSCG-928-O06]|nr:Hpt domain-containing protein [Ruminococcaceae bacterium OttesenSCG-928-O06]
MFDAENNKEYLDLESALARVRGNKTIYRKMLGMLQGSGEFAAFEEKIAAEDWAAAGEVAHGIKGMTGNLGLTKLFETSAELMNQLRAGPPSAALLAEYRDTVEKTLSLVQQLCDEWDAAGA